MAVYHSFLAVIMTQFSKEPTFAQFASERERNEKHRGTAIQRERNRAREFITHLKERSRGAGFTVLIDFASVVNKVEVL